MTEQRLPTLRETLRIIERETIIAALERTNAHVTRAAKQLGIGRSSLHYRMRVLGIDRRAARAQKELVLDVAGVPTSFRVQTFDARPHPLWASP